MIVKLIWICFSFVLVSCSQFKYPNVRRYENITDEYYGVKVHDPYRWLEELNNEAIQNFVEKQNKVTEDYLRGINEFQDIEDKLYDVNLDTYTRFDIFQRFGSKYFNFTRGSQNSEIFYVQDSRYGKRRVLLDCTKFYDDGTILTSFEISPNGEYLAYGISERGSDLAKIHVKNTSNGIDFPEILNCVRWGEVYWTPDNIGFFYSRYSTNRCQVAATTSHTHDKLYYHIVGTNQSRDILAIEFPFRPTYLICGMHVTSDGKYILLYLSDDAVTSLWYYVDFSDYLRLRVEITSKLICDPLVPRFAHDFTFITSKGSMLYFCTSHNASNSRIIKMDLKRPEPEYWIEIVPEHPKNVIKFAKVINNDKLIIGYLEDVKVKLVVHFLRNGSFFMDIPLGFGTITSTEVIDDKLYFQFESFVDPSVIYCIDFQQHPILSITAFKTPKKFDKANFVTKQVFYASKDGTKIPMFIFHKKDYIYKGNSPTLLHVYGGYKDSMTPRFASELIVFIENFDGVFAMPNIRGGGEYGQTWYEEARSIKKQNGLDDVHSAAEYLISQNYTNPSKLVLYGSSNGGTMVLASINQRPELYGAAVAVAGITDFLRFQKFAYNRVYCKQVGCSDDKNITIFENLMRLSPLHNVRLPINKSVQYPAVLLMTGEVDDRVAPIHSYKLISELQHTIGRNPRQTNPLLLQVYKQVEHAAQSFVDIFAFMMRTIGMNFYPNVRATKNQPPFKTPPTFFNAHHTASRYASENRTESYE